MTQILNDKYKTPSSKQGTRVRIPWKTADTIATWNETCAWAIEQYGMPGTVYTTHPTEDYMDFYFHKEEHAIHFSLRWL